MSSTAPRRDFLATALATGTAAVGIATMPKFSEAAPQESAKRQYYELWIYPMSPGDMVRRADDYFQHALIPALGRAGVGPVGVFVESGKAKAPAMHVLIAHSGIESVAALPATLQNDAEYQKAGAAFIAAPPKEPAYVNHEARLMIAAPFMPKLEVPQKQEARVFELRRYRNPSEAAFRKKVEMFATAELTIFRHVGLNPVFFGQMLFGPDMFNITYMLTFPDGAAHAKAWGEFGQDADWQKLRITPGYTDAEIIANISSLMLKPTAYSQI